jgi:hypothetical protein
VQAWRSTGKPKSEKGRRRIDSRKKSLPWRQAKKLEIDAVEVERAYKLQEQNMNVQAEYCFQFFKEQFLHREVDRNNNRGASNEPREGYNIDMAIY